MNLSNRRSPSVIRERIFIPQAAWDRLEEILRVPQPDPEAGFGALVALEERRRISYLIKRDLTSYSE